MWSVLSGLVLKSVSLFSMETWTKGMIHCVQFCLRGYLISSDLAEPTKVSLTGRQHVSGLVHLILDPAF